jgi:hypothetical protein
MKLEEGCGYDVWQNPSEIRVGLFRRSWGVSFELKSTRSTISEEGQTTCAMVNYPLGKYRLYDNMPGAAKRKLLPQLTLDLWLIYLIYKQCCISIFTIH